MRRFLKRIPNQLSSPLQALAAQRPSVSVSKRHCRRIVNWEFNLTSIPIILSRQNCMIPKRPYWQIFQLESRYWIKLQYCNIGSISRQKGIINKNKDEWNTCKLHNFLIKFYIVLCLNFLKCYFKSRINSCSSQDLLRSIKIILRLKR